MSHHFIVWCITDAHAFVCAALGSLLRPSSGRSRCGTTPTPRAWMCWRTPWASTAWWRSSDMSSTLWATPSADSTSSWECDWTGCLRPADLHYLIQLPVIPHKARIIHWARDFETDVNLIQHICARSGSDLGQICTRIGCSLFAPVCRLTHHSLHNREHRYMESYRLTWYITNLLHFKVTITFITLFLHMKDKHKSTAVSFYKHNPLIPNRTILCQIFNTEKCKIFFEFCLL